MSIASMYNMNTVSLLDRLFHWIESRKESDSLLIKIAVCAVFVSFLWCLVTLAQSARTQVATEGGTLREGIVGTPRFVNPVLAVTKADKDVAELVYDGLMSIGKDGVLVPDLAESVTVSGDGLTYNIVLRKDVFFHDGTPLTIRDVMFTLERITDPMVVSPLRPNFADVTLEEVGEYELNIVLREPYTPFIENLTFGILPEHIWKDVSAEEFPFSNRNSEPIGTGPFTITSLHRSESGIPLSYTLSPYQHYHKGTPKIGELSLIFFPNETKLFEAFRKGDIDSAVIQEHELLRGYTLPETHTRITSPLPRSFALFINQNKSVPLREKGVREALNTALDRETLITDTLGGYGVALSGPIPQGFGIDTMREEDPQSDLSPEERIEQARGILSASGWKRNEETGTWEKTIDKVVTPLSVSIATVNSPRFEAVAEYVQGVWAELGVEVTIKQFEQSDLTQTVIRPRDYDILLFGTHLGRPLDLFPFWHSSQRNDPGLNVALYANITTDALLEQARTTPDRDVWQEALTQFERELAQETPAIFLYQPELVYLLPTSVKYTPYPGIAEPHERWSMIADWYIETESIWNIFTNHLHITP